MPAAEEHHVPLVSSAGEDAARISMTNEAVLDLLRRHFEGADATYLCPSIPGKKELGARAVHAAHLPSDERVLALHDDSVFGSGEEGFVVTRRRLCWKNGTERAHMIEWQHIDTARMYADRKKLVLGDFAIELSGEDEAVIEACEAAFHILALSARAPQGPAHSGIAPVRGETRARATTPSGLAAAEPLALRSSKHPTLRPSHPAAVSPPGPLESAITPNAEPRSSTADATPPPPHAVSYATYLLHAASQTGPEFACWHCMTPLYWETPQCAGCSALPAPEGWLRTA